MSCSRKYKIEKKVREHNRKVRKDAKLNPKKKKADPGIPNLFPFKEQILQKAQKEKENKVTMSHLLAASRKSVEMEDKNDQNEEDAVLDYQDNSKKSFYKEFRKVVDQADVLLQVLDARDPMGCRTKSVETLVKEKGKKMIFILNKIDLVPKENALKWLSYLRNECPTIAFKSSTQMQRNNLGQKKVSATTASANLLQSSDSLGADALIKILKNYSRNMDIKTSITVGVVGFPNVGKSSVINSLKRSRVCNVGSTPGKYQTLFDEVEGITKCQQEIHLDKNLKLLDCPGIVFSKNSDLLLRNCINVDSITDPIAPVEAIISRCPKQQWTMIYGIPEFSDVFDFLLHIARQKGKLKKGGVADLKAAAIHILRDWNSGRIPFYTIPPKNKVIESSIVVESMAPEFNLEKEDIMIFDSIKDSGSSKFMKCNTTEFIDVMVDENMSEYDANVMEEEFDEEMSVDAEVEPMANAIVIQPKLRTKKVQFEVAENALNDFERQINPQLNKDKKNALKKKKKNEKRAANAVATQEKSAGLYKFEEDFNVFEESVTPLSDSESD